MAQRVYVGLSGGVDSAVSAALLKQAGYEVVGAFIKIWRPEFTECTWREDRLDAMRVCAALDIPYKEVDLSDLYKRHIVDSMLADYAHGITPNPDVLCNREIKFGAFAAWALQDGADKVATGHYARIDDSSGTPRLKRAADSAKDQTYFLHLLRSSDLAHTIFPVGGLLKSEVRKLAVEFDLPVARKHDSQGLCFVGAVSMRDFLSAYVPVVRGNVLTESGEIVGDHDGAALYTVGQRHGFRVAGTKPHYVTKIDVEENVVYVSDNIAHAMRRTVGMQRTHWIAGAPNFPHTASAQARYREKAVPICISSDTYACFDEPHIAAPGQSIVFYDQDICLGGAVIS